MIGQRKKSTDPDNQFSQILAKFQVIRLLIIQNDMVEKDQAFVEYLVKAIVAYPDDVKVDRIIDERGVLLSLTVNPSDIGYVIGRQGQTAKAIRTLTKIIGAKNNARVNLKILEPEGSRRSRDEREEAPVGDVSNAGPSTMDAIDGIDDLTI